MQTPPIFRWNVIATRACCLSGAISLLWEMMRRPLSKCAAQKRFRDLIFFARLAFQLTRGGRAAYKSHMISTLCQSANQPTITRFHYQYPIKCSSSIVEFAPKIPSSKWWPWCTWCQPHVSCLTLSCPIVQRD